MQAQINCPKCGTPIDVNKVLFEKVSSEVGQQYETTIAKEREALAAEKKKVEAAQKEVEAQVNAAVSQQLTEAKKEQEAALRSSIKGELEEGMNALQQELNRKSEEVKEFNKTKTALAQLQREKDELAGKMKVEAEEKLAERLAAVKKEQEQAIRSEVEAAQKVLQDELTAKSEQIKELNKTKVLLAQTQREKDELAEKLKAEAETQLNERLTKAKVDIAKAEADKQELKLKEKEELIASLKTQMDDMKRRAEQGSMQSQGEVQELAIEEWLRGTFPFDSVEEISKGVRGGDCIHRVHDRTGHELGAIYYESKRTKHFTEGWIAKLKQDMQAAMTQVGVIVTEAMPADMERMGQRNGIWICTYEEFKGLCFALREMMLQVGQAVSAQQNKGDKMEMLYNYLTGSEYRMHIEAIVQSYTKLKNDITTERRAYERMWKEREKNLDLVISNTAQMYGSIKGIAGNAIAPVQSLELPPAQEEEMDFE
ncbi:MAG TPA: DUF2130 domain-containing protein [Flavobacteriales bacterium]|nr:DUF2130 domain-containing protein [Flavobacteriales bacterium]HNI04167.1 DUF2130 domain-containing protein [Flavobacteriales bacterium]HNK40300.1 DUF2130 domain-containing protein [Flavobacteriales bacterium]